MAGFTFEWIASVITFGLVCLLAGWWLGGRSVKCLNEEYLDAATSLWLAGTMAVTGSTKRKSYYKVYSIDFEDLKIALKGMEKTMRKYEEESQ